MGTDREHSRGRLRALVCNLLLWDELEERERQRLPETDRALQRLIASLLERERLRAQAETSE